jgi:hypothetical protein
VPEEFIVIWKGKGREISGPLDIGVSAPVDWSIVKARMPSSSVK